jgi:hypothetical protein
MKNVARRPVRKPASASGVPRTCSQVPCKFQAVKKYTYGYTGAMYMNIHIYIYWDYTRKQYRVNDRLSRLTLRIIKACEFDFEFKIGARLTPTCLGPS